jgi:CheY-like chemotaxis protein
MDLNMPKMGGIETTEIIRGLDSKKSEIIIIALTANVMQEDKEKCFEVGMNDFIKKPFSLKELKETLEKWI